MFWDHWEEEGTRGQEHMTFIMETELGTEGQVWLSSHPCPLESLSLSFLSCRMGIMVPASHDLPLECPRAWESTL